MTAAIIRFNQIQRLIKLTKTQHKKHTCTDDTLKKKETYVLFVQLDGCVYISTHQTVLQSLRVKLGFKRIRN